MTSESEARAVKQRHAAELLKRPGVSGVGVEKNETGQYVLAIHLNSDDPRLSEQLPTEIEGLPVRLLASGPFRKFSR